MVLSVALPQATLSWLGEGKGTANFAICFIIRSPLSRGCTAQVAVSGSITIVLIDHESTVTKHLIKCLQIRYRADLVNLER